VNLFFVHVIGFKLESTGLEILDVLSLREQRSEATNYLGPKPALRRFIASYGTCCNR
jgi:hypothetical protein